MKEGKRQLRGRAKVPPRWLIAVTALAGLGVDLATLVWLWDAYDTVDGLTIYQAVIAAASVLVATSLLGLSAVLGIERTHG